MTSKAATWAWDAPGWLATPRSFSAGSCTVAGPGLARGLCRGRGGPGRSCWRRPRTSYRTGPAPRPGRLGAPPLVRRRRPHRHAARWPGSRSRPLLRRCRRRSRRGRSRRTRAVCHPSRPRCGSGSGTSPTTRAWHGTGPARPGGPGARSACGRSCCAHRDQQPDPRIVDHQRPLPAQHRHHSGQHRGQALAGRGAQHRPGQRQSRDDVAAVDHQARCPDDRDLQRSSVRRRRRA